MLGIVNHGSQTFVIGKLALVSFRKLFGGDRQTKS